MQSLLRRFKRRRADDCKKLSLVRFAPGFSEIQILAQQAAYVVQPSVEGETELQFIADADGYYMHITHMRRTRSVVSEVLTQCCVVLRELDTHTATDTSADPLDALTAAEGALEAFGQTQQLIRAKPVTTSTLTKRNDERRNCVHLIDSALQQRLPVSDIGRRAKDALMQLRPNATDLRETNTEALAFDALQGLCSVARHKAEQLALDLSFDSAVSAASDSAAADVRDKLASAVLRGFGYSGAGAGTKRECMGVCVASLNAEMAIQAETNAVIMKEKNLAGILRKLEVALEAVCGYYGQTQGLDMRFAQLELRRMHLREGLTAPNLKIVKDHITNSLSTTEDREAYIAKITLAKQAARRGSDKEKEELESLRVEFEEWERDTRRREKSANRNLTQWLQFATKHYPEVLRDEQVLKCLSAEELGCAQLGLLRKGDSAANYPQVAQLSDRSGRPVWRGTDANGRDIVVKSYNLTTEAYSAHFLSTCAKLGALRGVLNIAPVLGVFTENEWGRVIMPYNANGDLAAWIDAHPQRDARVCLRMMHQIVSAVHGLHALEIVHCDLKPKNIFITSTHQALLGDFDNVRVADSTMTSAAGTTRAFAAPEILSGKVTQFEKSADVYSLGLVLKALLCEVCTDGIFSTVTHGAVENLIQEMTHTDSSRRPTLAHVLARSLFSELTSERVCGVCLDTSAVAESLTCSNGHVVCNECMDRALQNSLEGEHLEHHNGLLPCVMEASGCDSMWEPKQYASHVATSTFDKAICKVTMPAARKQVLIELQREAAEDREFHHIENNILPLRCPMKGHVLEEKFEGCFALKCGACPRGRKEFCALCWKSFGAATHIHVSQCTLNPNPGSPFNPIEVFYDGRRLDRCKRLKAYWATLLIDDERKRKLEQRVQPLLDQLVPEGTYGSIASIVA